jgi:membrane protease YdiL (CAAX protease family)
MNYVFCWATLRGKSVIPSTVAHGVWNMIVIGGVNEAVAWNAELSVILWVVLAILLFRYWPVRGEEGQVTNAATPDSAVTV